LKLWKRIVRDSFPYITETETTTFKDCVGCLITFTSGSDASLNAIAFLTHLSLHCPFAQGVWGGLTSRLGLPDITPRGTIGIADWWLLAVGRFARDDRKRANSLIMLVLRSLWVERNSRVFEQKRRAMAITLDLIAAEWQLWLDCRGRSVRGLG
jgi:hypothetical protein